MSACRLSIRRVFLLAPLAVAACSPMRLSAQGNELVVVQGQRAKDLAGKVVAVWDGEALADVSVIIFKCGKGEFRGVIEPSEIAHTKTDSMGRFFLTWPTQTHVCIQFQTPGMNTLQMEVRRSAKAGNLHPKLVPGT
jgi:hypothetical protein